MKTGAMDMRIKRIAMLAAIVMLIAGTAWAEVRVQDVARLQGQRTNRLTGFGLVVGLNGTGDGAKNSPTMRALMALHRRYHQPVLDAAELEKNDSVALVTVEAVIPEFGAREGQAVDVIVSAVGPAKSLAGGQLLTTPLQESMLVIPNILALAGGRIELPDAKSTRRAVIRNGATLEEDFFYNFIDGQYVTLVLDDAHAGWTWAQMVARAINHRLKTPGADGVTETDASGGLVVVEEIATAFGPKNVRVRIPSYELASPANFIRLVLEAPIFELPRQAARVVINRATRQVSFTGAVTLSPAILQIPGLGTITIGKTKPEERTRDDEKSAAANVTRLEELMQALAAVQATPEQTVAAVEHLYNTGALHALLEYSE